MGGMIVTVGMVRVLLLFFALFFLCVIDSEVDRMFAIFEVGSRL